MSDFKQTHYTGLSDVDRRQNVEGRLLNVLSAYGGKRIVAGKTLNQLVQDLANEFYRMNKDGLL